MGQIVDSELVFRLPGTANDSSSNGGRPSATLKTLSNFLPRVSSQERAAGLTRYRAFFPHVANSENRAFVNSGICLLRLPEGDARLMFFPGTYTDTQADILPARLYGAGYLASGVSEGDGEIQVLFEDGDDTGIQAPDAIMIARMAVNGDTATIQQFEMATVESVAGTGDTKTITLSAPLASGFDASQSTDADGYLTAYTIVSAIYYFPPEIQAGYSGFTVTSAGGSYNHTANPVKFDGRSAIYQQWTLPFASATAFNVVGDTLGAVGSGNLTSNLQPINPAFSQPYFTLLSAGWGGAFSAGDTVTFLTTPAMPPKIWVKFFVPAGAGASIERDLFYWFGDVE